MYTNDKRPPITIIKNQLYKRFTIGNMRMKNNNDETDPKDSKINHELHNITTCE